MLSSRRYTIKEVIGQINCPYLVIEAEGDMFFKGQPQEVYDALQAPRQLFEFTSEDGAEHHWPSGALAYKDKAVFDWIDETLKLHDASKG